MTRAASSVFFLLATFLVSCTEPSDVRAERAETVRELSRARDEARRELHAHDADIAVPTTLTLGDAISIATRNSRDYQTQRELLYLDAVGLGVTRHLFRDPILSAQLSYTYAGGRHVPSTNTGAAQVSATQILPTGAQVVVQGIASMAETRQSSAVFPDPNTNVQGSVSVTQPLLKGVAPYAFEPLTQGERDLVYASRDFELFRQLFAIQVVSNYYGLVQKKQHVANAHAAVSALEFVAKSARAFFEVGQQSKIDMLRAEQAWLAQKSNLIDEEQAYQLAIDNFKIFMGVPIGTVFEIPDEVPSVVPVELELDGAVHTALEKRLDLRTAQERVEDAERQVSVARNNLLPSFNAVASYAIASDPAPGSRGNELAFRNDSYQAGLVLEIPLERAAERRDLRIKIVAVDQARRELERAEDQVVVDVRNGLRQLRAQRESIKVQEAIIETETARATYAEIRYKLGEIDSRELTESRANLIVAQNARIDGIVAYEVSRLSLMKTLGTLAVTEEGAVAK